MPQLTQPVGQVRLTNIAVVRLKLRGRLFEVAAYKNKVVDWRARVEADHHEVLQAPTVFHSVSRGVVAGREALLEAFGSADHLRCALAVLERGELAPGPRPASPAEHVHHVDVHEGGHEVTSGASSAAARAASGVTLPGPVAPHLRHWTR